MWIKKWGLLLLLSLIGWMASAQEEGSKRSMSLGWEEIPDSTGYEIELLRILSDGKKRPPITFKTKAPEWSGKIVPGTYQMRLRSFDDRSVPGDWSDSSEVVVRVLPVVRLEPAEKAKIKTNEAKEYETVFKWSPVPDAVKYKIVVTNDKGEEVAKQEVDSTEAKISLPVGLTYSWSVQGISKENIEGEGGSNKSEVTLIGRRVDPPSIDKPDSKFVTKVEWQKPDFADKFDYVVSRKTKAGKWVEVEKKAGVTEPFVTLDPKKPGGLYRVQVKAYGEKRESSTTSSVEFPVYEGLRTPAAIETAKLREAMELDRDHYFIATYLLTTLDYRGSNKEFNDAKVSYQALSGAGRLGYGYMPKGQWGFTATFDYAGVILEGKNYLFSSAEIQSVWRKFLGQATQLRVFGGLYAKEIPEAKGFSGQPVTVENIHQLGPTTGFQLWHSLTYDLGVQINASANLAVLKLKTPSGGAIKPTLSHQLGLMFSYRLKQNVTGFAGVARRADVAAYESKQPSSPMELNFAKPGDKNEVSMIGTYLNLYLEWGF